MIYSPFPGGTPVIYVHGGEVLRFLDPLTALLLLLLCGHTNQTFKISSFTAYCYNLPAPYSVQVKRMLQL